jgi:hypothetical protein
MLGRWYRVQLDSLWSPVSRHYFGPGVAPTDDEADARFARVPQQSMDLLIAILPDIEGLLTAEQRALLPSEVAGYIDRGRLAAIGERSTDALFAQPESQQGRTRIGGPGR